MKKQHQLQALDALGQSEQSRSGVYQHHRGIIRDNAIQALLHDKLFRQRIEKKRKGKGSYERKAKHVVRYTEKSDNQTFDFRNLIIRFFF